MRPAAREVLSSDGVVVRYEVAGRGAPALVLVHGWSCDRSYRRGQVGYFAGRNTVVTVDLGGHVDPGAGRSLWTMGAFGEDVVAVLDARPAIGGAGRTLDGR